MRKVSFAFAVGLVLFGCGGGEANLDPNTAATPPEATTPPTTTAEAPKPEAKPELTPAQKQEQAMKAYVEAFNAHDAKKLAGFYTDGATVTMPGNPELKGREAIQNHYQQLFTAFPDLKTMPARVFTKGDVVVTEWVMNGTHQGEMHGLKATEKKIGIAGADVVWMTPEAQIKEQHVYYDMGTLMSQLGVSKQKARGVAAMPANTQAVASTNGPEEQKNLEASKNWTKAFETKKADDFVANVADEIEWDDVTQPETMKGKDSGKKYFQGMLKAFPDAKATQTNAWAVGDFVISEGTFEGTHKGNLFGVIPPTNKKVNMHGLDIVQYKDGKVVKGWSYGNSLEMMTQLGLAPKPPADAKKPEAKAADPKAAPAAPAAPAKK